MLYYYTRNLNVFSMNYLSRCLIIMLAQIETEKLLAQLVDTEMIRRTVTFFD